MSWKKVWTAIILLLVLISPLNIEAKANLSNMNLLENIETESTQDELIIKLYFKKDLKFFEQPIFYKKSIQIDFPRAYSQPAKRFLTTQNDQISQIYVSQFNAQKMRIRFIFGKGEKGSYSNRFHLQKNDNLLTIRIDLNEVDLLDQLLASTAKKIHDNKNSQATNNTSQKINNEIIVEEKLRFPVKRVIENDLNISRSGLSEQIKTASFNKNPDWNTDKGKLKNPSKSNNDSSFKFIKSKEKQLSKSAELLPSSFKMIMTLSLVLGLIFLLFSGFKKYVLKNTVFGGGKLIQVVSTNYLAPKKNISLVEVAGEILVLGISDQNISLLTSIREP